MKRLTEIVLLAIIIWLISFYSYAGLVIANKASYSTNIKPIDAGNYWNPNPYFIVSEDKWGIRVWKWREFLACGYQGLDANSNITYVNWSRDGLIEISLLSPFDLDWVYVAGVSMGSVWPNVKPVYQPEPLEVSRLESLVLETRISNLKGVPLSPLILPSWYAVLTDLWFEVKDVIIDGKHYDKKVLGIDIFYSTMTSRHEYYDNGQPRILYMMYVDRGDTPDDNLHYVINSSPSDVYTAEVVRVNATTFAARINDTTIQTWTCSDGNNSDSPCNKMKMFGAVSWGTKYNNSSFNVNALIYDLQVKRSTDTQYQLYTSVTSTLIKCYEDPADLGFKSPRTSNSYNQMVVDAFNRDDCPRSLLQSSTVWLYNDGNGG